VTHAVTFLTKTLAAKFALEWLRLLVDPQMVFEVPHLLEHLLAFVHAAHEELTSSNCSVIRRLNMIVLGKRVNRLYGVVRKECNESL